MEDEFSKFDSYFAASNSSAGFFSAFDDCFDRPEITHVYAVKGGPGTGKSRFMAEVAAAAREHGYRVEYIRCSSDPASLDGVILRGKERTVAFCDATSPHVYEPRHPGVREEFVNLGAFWDADLLAAKEKEIDAASKEKSEAYRRAYRYLSAAGEMFEESILASAPFLKKDLLSRFVEKFSGKITEGKEYSCRPSILSGIGMEGQVRLNTFFSLADVSYVVEDCHNTAVSLFAQLGNLAVEKKARIRVSYDPVLPQRIDGILFCDDGIAVALGDADALPGPARKIRMRHFLDVGAMRSVKARVRYAERMKDAMIDGAIDAMRSVKEAHFRIEALYGGAMDFSAKEKFTKAFISHLFQE